MRAAAKVFVGLVALAALLTHAPARADEVEEDDEDDRSLWADSEMLTKMWGAISSKDMEKLKQLLEDNPSAVDERASDGRGPLWWAYEYKSDEAVEMLTKFGVKENAKDADGKTALDMAKETAGKKTAYVQRKMEKDAADAAKAAAEASSSMTDSAQVEQMYRLFNVRSVASDAELEAAYKVEATKYQPENISPGADREQTEQTLRYLTQVYSALTTYRKAQPPPTPVYDDDDEEEEEEEDDYNDEL